MRKEYQEPVTRVDGYEGEALMLPGSVLGGDATPPTGPAKLTVFHDDDEDEAWPDTYSVWE